MSQSVHGPRFMGQWNYEPVDSWTSDFIGKWISVLIRSGVMDQLVYGPVGSWATGFVG